MHKSRTVRPLAILSLVAFTLCFSQIQVIGSDAKKTTTRRVVISGFEPFGGRRDNASYIFAKALVDAAKGRFELVQVPVVWGEPKKCIEKVAGGKRIDLWIAFGEGKSEAFWLETLACNERSGYPDNLGQTPLRPLIESKGPAQRHADPEKTRAFVSRLREKNISAKQSTSAGKYLCEEMLYQLLSKSVGKKRLIKDAYFFHLPVLSEPYVDTSGQSIPFTSEQCTQLALKFLDAIDMNL